MESCKSENHGQNKTWEFLNLYSEYERYSSDHIHTKFETPMTECGARDYVCPMHCSHTGGNADEFKLLSPSSSSNSSWKRTLAKRMCSPEHEPAG